MPLPLLLGLAAVAGAGAKVVKNQIDKAKETSALIDQAEENCANEAKTYEKQRKETELQQKMRMLLIDHAFSEAEKTEFPPHLFEDWKHIPAGTWIRAARKYSSFSWNEYTAFTDEAIYYHNKRKGIHDFLYYDGINGVDIEAGVVDYGKNRTKRDIGQWPNFEKRFVEQIGNIWKINDETDTSILEFCFNHCRDFNVNLSYFKTDTIRSAFRRQCKGKHGVLQKNWEHIQVVNMASGKIELQYWEYFPMVETVKFYDDDSEAEVEAKKLQQEALEEKAKERQWKAEDTHFELVNLSSDIAEVFQKALYDLYGVLYEKKNIAFLEEPNFTYEGPSVVDRIESTVGSVMNFASDYVERNCK